MITLFIAGVALGLIAGIALFGTVWCALAVAHEEELSMWEWTREDLLDIECMTALEREFSEIEHQQA
jgi:hypothetical protein